jgi:hypothetical protein
MYWSIRYGKGKFYFLLTYG